MSFVRLIFQSIRYHRRLHLGLFAGTFIVCAALSGALVVGDSVRRTLYGIAEARLGGVSHALDWGNRYFAAGLADAMLAGAAPNEGLSDDVIRDSPSFAAVLAVRGIAEPPPEQERPLTRINRAWVYGVDESFWRLAPAPESSPLPGPQEALINEAAAEALSLQAGDAFMLRVPRPSLMPLDAPLSRGGDGDTAIARLRVSAVLTEAQWGRFSLATDQALPPNIFLDRRWLGELLDLPGKANLLLTDAATPHLGRILAEVWQPETIGLRLRANDSGRVQLESERIFIETPVVRAAEQAGNAHPTLSYLVNSIRAGDRATPYSFVVAGAAPADTPGGAVCINQWLADILDAGPGDTLQIAWSEPLPTGEYVERHVEAPVHRVIPMEALTVERDLAPQFPGLSDVDSCRDWDIGLPLDDDKLLDEANEAYWKAYGQTPKLLTDYPTGSAWWGSRFGAVTALRFAGDDAEPDILLQRLREALDPADIGLVFMPVREEAQRAVAQALDFGALFAGMSIFLIAAGLVLLGLLHAHGLQMRTGEIGALTAVGWRRRRIGTWLLLESLPALCLGACTGAPGGAAYARLLLFGLVRFWPDAVAGTPLRYHASPVAMAQGALAAVCCVLLVIAFSVVRAGRRPVRELLERDFSALGGSQGKGDLHFLLAVLLVLPLAMVSFYQAFWGDVDNPTAWFFASGAAGLAAVLAAYGLALGYLKRRPTPVNPWLWRILLSQLARRRSRSLGVATVTACGVFMVVSVAAMQASMRFEPAQPHSGAGGFSVFATTTIPVRGDEERPLGFAREDIVPLRLWDGDDAGCLNLNHAQRPRLYGVNPEIMVARGAFAFPDEVEALWSLLDMPLEDGVAPALVGDSDTAMWGLQAVTDPDHGTEIEYRDDTGSSFRVRTVGALPMRLSLFQGTLLISEYHFTRLFPHAGGYRAFLVDAANPEETTSRLNRDFGRMGMEAVTSLDRLRAFHAVERAYLAMFLILGGLGMSLGAGGAAVIVLRNLAERRGEFALLVAVGYEPRLVRRLAIIENTCLVAAGLLFGAGAAAMATMPLLFQAQVSLNHAALAVVLSMLVIAYIAAVVAVTWLFLARIPLSALRTE